MYFIIAFVALKILLINMFIYPITWGKYIYQKWIVCIPSVQIFQVSNVTWQKQQRIDQIWRNSTTKIVYHLNIHIHKKYLVIAIYQEWLLIIHNSTFTNTASTLTRIWRIIHAKNIYFFNMKMLLKWTMTISSFDVF